MHPVECFYVISVNSRVIGKLLNTEAIMSGEGRENQAKPARLTKSFTLFIPHCERACNSEKINFYQRITGSGSLNG